MTDQSKLSRFMDRQGEATIFLIYLAFGTATGGAVGTLIAWALS